MSIKKKEEMRKETFDFSEALRRMKEGKKVKRRIWSNGTTFINKKKIYVRCVSYNDMGINDRSHKGKTFWYEVIDKRESVGSHFSIINKGVRTDYNIIFKRIDNGKLFPCKDVEYGDYIQYQLNYKYSITEEDMQRLSGIYNRDFYK